MSIFSVNYPPFRDIRARASVPEILSLKWIVLLTLVGVAAIAGVVEIFRAQNLGWAVVLVDPASQFDFPAYAGLFTYASVMVLIALFAVCLFVRSEVAADASGPEAQVLGLVGLLSLLLALDDLFLLHEGLLRHQFGISEMAVFAVYGALGLAILWLIGTDVLSRAFLGLWAAVGFLVLMTVADKAEKFLGTTAPLLLAEETAKFCGFVLWTAFWMSYARVALRGTDTRR